MKSCTGSGWAATILLKQSHFKPLVFQQGFEERQRDPFRCFLYRQIRLWLKMFEEFPPNFSFRLLRFSWTQDQKKMCSYSPGGTGCSDDLGGAYRKGDFGLSLLPKTAPSFFLSFQLLSITAQHPLTERGMKGQNYQPQTNWAAYLHSDLPRLSPSSMLLLCRLSTKKH